MLHRLLRARALSLLLVLTACDGGLTGPDGGELAFVEGLDLAGLEEAVVSSGSVQVEVALVPGGLTAHELGIRTDDRSHEERIQGRVAAWSAEGDAGSVTLLMGDLAIRFDAGTRFWMEGETVSRGAFLEALQADLEAGEEPAVVAERPAADPPQDPADDTFVARDLARSPHGEPRIRMNVDQDNIEVVVSPRDDEPDAWLTVLGLRIGIRSRDGTTEIEARHHDFDVREFEGRVTAVSLDAGTFTLEGGSVFRVVDRTEVVEGEGKLPSLRAVAEALEGDGVVFAHGLAGAESDGAESLLTVKVTFVVRSESDAVHESFEGEVRSVDLEAGSFTLVDGTVVRVVDGTHVEAANDASPAGLAGVAEALEAGATVVAWGRGEVEATEPLVLAGIEVVFKRRLAEDHHHREFEGTVSSVDLEARTFSLGDGTVVRLLAETEVRAYDEASPASLEGVAEALAAGRTVAAWGHGEVEGSEPTVFAALGVTFKTRREEFEGHVASVDVEAGTFTLESGVVVRVGDGTAVVGYGELGPSSLAEAAEMVAAGRIVVAWGHGFVASREPLVIDASEVTFRVKVEDFATHVVSVDLEAGTLALDGGWVVRVTGETEVGAADQESPADLAGVADALAAGDAVKATGWGWVEGVEPVRIEAVAVTFQRIVAG